MTLFEGAAKEVTVTESSSASDAKADARVTVFCSGAFFSTMQALGPVFEKAKGCAVDLVSAPSMGPSPTTIPARLKRGEPADVVIMAENALEQLVADGLVDNSSHVKLVNSKIGMCVKAGAPKPDISTQAAFEAALMAAKSIGVSASASGTYFLNTGFAKLGEPRASEVKAKARQIIDDKVGDRVAIWVARGVDEIGFQEVSELLPIPGIDFVGPVPAPYQLVTVFSTGVVAYSKRKTEAQALIAFLTSSAAFPIIRANGLEPTAEAAQGGS